MKFIETQDSQIINVSNVILFEKICNERDVVHNYKIVALLTNDTIRLGNYKTYDEMSIAYFRLITFLKCNESFHTMKKDPEKHPVDYPQGVSFLFGFFSF